MSSLPGGVALKQMGRKRGVKGGGFRETILNPI